MKLTRIKVSKISASFSEWFLWHGASLWSDFTLTPGSSWKGFIFHFLCRAQSEVFSESFLFFLLLGGWGGVQAPELQICVSLISSHCKTGDREAQRGQIYPGPGHGPVVLFHSLLWCSNQQDGHFGPPVPQWETCALICMALWDIAWEANAWGTNCLYFKLYMTLRKW